MTSICDINNNAQSVCVCATNFRFYVFRLSVYRKFLRNYLDVALRRVTKTHLLRDIVIYDQHTKIRTLASQVHYPVALFSGVK